MGVVQYDIGREGKAVAIYIKDMSENGILSRWTRWDFYSPKIVTNVVTNEKWRMEIKSTLRKAGMTVDDA